MVCIFRCKTKQILYRNLYKTLNNGSNPLKILRDCQTRWLAIKPAVERVLGQWMELTTLFSITRHSDKRYTCELLYEMYSDEKYLLYFLFLNPVLIEVQQVNKLLEANELILLITSIGKKIVLPTSNIDILTIKVDDFLNPKPCLGYQIETKVAEMKFQGTLINTEENDIQIRCSNFLIALIKQLKQRLPENIKILKDMSYLSVNYMLQPVKNASAICDVMKFLGINEDTISKADYQLQEINSVDWVNKMNTEKFWSEVGVLFFFILSLYLSSWLAGKRRRRYT